QSPRTRLPRRGGRGTGMGRGMAPPPHGLTPVLRLLALLAIVVALLVFFGLLIQSCASTSKHSAATSYFDKVGTIARSSQADGTAKGDGEGAVLAEQADRLLASDVVYDDLFSGPATAELKSDGISGVTVPASKFVANRDMTTDRSMAALLARLRGTTSGGGTPTGLHGTNIVDVKTLPGGQTLALAPQTNTVVATTGLASVVAIADSGRFQEVGI